MRVQEEGSSEDSYGGEEGKTDKGLDLPAVRELCGCVGCFPSSNTPFTIVSILGQVVKEIS